MSVSGEAPLFGAYRAVMAQMTGDVSGSPGTHSYNNAVEVPGPQGLDMNPNILAVPLKGGNVIRDIYTNVESIKGKLAFSDVSLVILKMVFGGIIEDTGSGPTARKTWTVHKGALPGAWSLELVVDYLGSENNGQGWHVYLPKCKITNFAISYSGEKHASISFDFEAFHRKSDGMLLQKWHEATLSEPVIVQDSTPPAVTSIVPADNAGSVANNATVTWNLTEKLRADFVDPDSAKNHFFVIKTADGTIVPGSFVWDNDDFTMVFTPTGTYSTGKHNTLLTGVRDEAGNLIEVAYSSDFTVT